MPDRSHLAVLHQPLSRRKSWLTAIDPRCRLVAVGCFALLFAAMQQPAALGAAACAVALLALGSGISIRQGLKRMAPLGVFLLMLLAVLPWTTGATPLLTLGPLAFTREGLVMATTMALKAAATIGLLVVLLGTLDLVTVGHALSHLHVPRKLIHLLLFTARYLGVLGAEYHRLRVAMKMRGFRARATRHGYRSLAYLAGMLLVRSLDRAERVIDAMKCRGFRGEFYLFDHFHYHGKDLAFAVGMSGVFVLLSLLEWT